MKEEQPQKIQKAEDNFRVERPKQTGFSSPATHYNEPRIDLNSVLSPNSESTFYIRVIDDSAETLKINKNDVLIVDRSLTPRAGQMVVAVVEDSFQIIKIKKDLAEEIIIWGVITYVIKAVL